MRYFYRLFPLAALGVRSTVRRETTRPCSVFMTMASLKRARSPSPLSPPVERSSPSKPKPSRKQGRRRGEPRVSRDMDAGETRDEGEKAPRLPKRQTALLIGFCGSGCSGMQMCAVSLSVYTSCLHTMCVRHTASRTYVPSKASSSTPSSVQAPYPKITLMIPPRCVCVLPFGLLFFFSFSELYRRRTGEAQSCRSD